jgi:hypothetical protein
MNTNALDELKKSASRRIKKKISNISENKSPKPNDLSMEPVNRSINELLNEDVDKILLQELLNEDDILSHENFLKNSGCDIKNLISTPVVKLMNLINDDKKESKSENNISETSNEPNIKPDILNRIRRHVSIFRKNNDEILPGVTADKSFDLSTTGVIIDDDITMCCVCYNPYDDNEDPESVVPIYLDCGHKLCKKCYGNLIENVIEIPQNNTHIHDPLKIKVIGTIKVMKKLCPLCRRPIDQILMNKDGKYAVMCLGKPAQTRVFDNGGYYGANILIFPEEKWESWNNITFDKDNYKFADRINELYNNGYMLVVQDYEEVCHWLEEILLKDLLTNFEGRIIKL